jgi:hypothetical protein
MIATNQAALMTSSRPRKGLTSSRSPRRRRRHKRFAKFILVTEREDFLELIHKNR